MGGHGDGADAERLVPPPRDFAADRWRFAPTPDAVRQVIVAGIPRTAMPGWGASLSARELDGLVAHVLTLAPPTGPPQAAGGALPSTVTAVLSRAGFTPLANPQPAPPLMVRGLNGDTITLADRRGRLVLVLFWGTTCAPCLAEMPGVARFAARQSERGLEVLSVCVDETDPSAVRAAAGPELAGLPHYLDPAGQVRLAYDVQALPSIALIDRAGRLIAQAVGTRDWTSPALDSLADLR
jgi:thiol-disulfide isomerase/thioredoxin